MRKTEPLTGVQMLKGLSARSALHGENALARRSSWQKKLVSETSTAIVEGIFLNVQFAWLKRCSSQMCSYCGQKEKTMTIVFWKSHPKNHFLLKVDWICYISSRLVSMPFHFMWILEFIRQNILIRSVAILAQTLLKPG